MIDFRAELDTLVYTKLGLPVHGLHFVPREFLGAGGTAALAFAGIPIVNQINFEVQDAGYGTGGVLQGADNRAFRGMTVCVQVGTDINFHVFLQEDNLRSTLKTEEDRELEKIIQQVIALTHEYGHIRDMMKGINFQFFPRTTVHLARAEAEAHAFTLEYFNKRALTPLRGLLSKTLLRLSEAQSPHEQAMYVALCSRVGKGRIKRWAAAVSQETHSKSKVRTQR